MKLLHMVLDDLDTDQFLPEGRLVLYNPNKNRFEVWVDKQLLGWMVKPDSDLEVIAWLDKHFKIKL